MSPRLWPGRRYLTASLDIVARAVASWAERPLVVGICGAQGSGKSTVSRELKMAFEAKGERVAVLSIDDLYLGRAARTKLAADVHPLFITRGVPGTHDVALGLDLLTAMKVGQTVRLPRFDKASDEPLPADEWLEVTAPSLILFEGWCVGAHAQANADLATPVNALEAWEDGDAVWRSHVNNALKGPYARLFAAIDRLVLLAAPDFAVVQNWRGQQERSLRKRLIREGRDPALAMSDDALRRFIAHYQRLTTHILREMPGRADLVLRLDEARRIVNVHKAEAHRA